MRRAPGEARAAYSGFESRLSLPSSVGSVPSSELSSKSLRPHATRIKRTQHGGERSTREQTRVRRAAAALEPGGAAWATGRRACGRAAIIGEDPCKNNRGREELVLMH